MVPARSELALGLRSAQKYAAVNGGVLIVAWLVTSIDWAVHSCTASLLASAALGTAVLYALVYRICASNLQDRRPIFAERRLPAIPLMALIWHPLGAMLERMLHGSGSCAPSAVAAVSELLPGWLLPRAFNWYGGLVLRLLAFELTFAFLVYLKFTLHFSLASRQRPSERSEPARDYAAVFILRNTLTVSLLLLIL